MLKTPHLHCICLDFLNPASRYTKHQPTGALATRSGKSTHRCPAGWGQGNVERAWAMEPSGPIELIESLGCHRSQCPSRQVGVESGFTAWPGWKAVLALVRVPAAGRCRSAQRWPPRERSELARSETQPGLWLAGSGGGSFFTMVPVPVPPCLDWLQRCCGEAEKRW